jgi:hypothetical protein
MILHEILPWKKLQRSHSLAIHSTFTLPSACLLHVTAL